MLALRIVSGSNLIFGLDTITNEVTDKDMQSELYVHCTKQTTSVETEGRSSGGREMKPLIGSCPCFADICIGRLLFTQLVTFTLDFYLILNSGLSAKM